MPAEYGEDTRSAQEVLDEEMESRRGLIEQIKRLAETLIEMFNNFQGQRPVPREQAQQNIQAFDVLSQRLEQYKQQALEEGDPQRAYMAENLHQSLKEFSERGASLNSVNRKEYAQMAEAALVSIKEEMAEIDREPEFEKLPNQYDRHSTKELERTRNVFRNDLATMVSESGFANERAESIVLQFSNKMNKTAEKKMRAKPITPAQYYAMDSEPSTARNPLDDYELDTAARPEEGIGPTPEPGQQADSGAPTVH